VGVGAERSALGDAAERFVEDGFDVGGEGEVLDLATVGAHPMVMVVLGQLLRQLEAGELGGGDEPVDEPSGLEHGDAPVCGTLGQLASPLQELGEGQRAAGVVERLDDRPVVAGVALALTAQPSVGDRVHVDHTRHRTGSVKSGSDSQNLAL